MSCCQIAQQLGTETSPEKIAETLGWSVLDSAAARVQAAYVVQVAARCSIFAMKYND